MSNVQDALGEVQTEFQHMRSQSVFAVRERTKSVIHMAILLAMLPVNAQVCLEGTRVRVLWVCAVARPLPHHCVPAGGALCCSAPACGSSLRIYLWHKNEQWIDIPASEVSLHFTPQPYSICASFSTPIWSVALFR